VFYLSSWSSEVGRRGRRQCGLLNGRRGGRGLVRIGFGRLCVVGKGRGVGCMCVENVRGQFRRGMRAEIRMRVVESGRWDGGMSAMGTGMGIEREMCGSIRGKRIRTMCIGKISLGDVDGIGIETRVGTGVEVGVDIGIQGRTMHVRR